MNRQDIIYWIDKIKKMEQAHLPELDHKDCGEISELLYCLMKEVEHLTISAFNQDRINKWIELTKLRDEADDHTRCPLCKEQMIGCDCVTNMAQDILESKFIRSLHPLSVNKGLVEVRRKEDYPHIVESIKGVKGTFADILFEALTIGGKEKKSKKRERAGKCERSN